MDKFDYREVETAEYSTSLTPSIVELNERNYITYHGKGKFDLSDSHFKEVIAAMYALANGIKEAASTSSKLEWFRDYEPYPLNSYWDADGSFTLMIKQPNFTIPELLSEAKDKLKSEFSPDVLDQIHFTREEEGAEVQLISFGQPDEDTFEKITNFIATNGLKVMGSGHRELFLDNLLTTPIEKLRVLLRVQIAKESIGNNLAVVTN
ncbi:hypothetical protein [Lentilactobacillus sp. Marseille-Q4993]|uniref:hypothetical protein n=1 Tax=Lentilactobacillus sp. Marseille-Q4993 TaxID=3039492 RepID=UPI0024BC7337|nr:hypothetical protein [Lentilactobacillus sp. Marseille-Q4993]